MKVHLSRTQEFKCRLCGVARKTKPLLLSHLQSHGRLKKETEAALSDERVRVVTPASRCSSEGEGHRSWTCLDCGENFQDAVSLKLHAVQQSCAEQRGPRDQQHFSAKPCNTVQENSITTKQHPVVEQKYGYSPTQTKQSLCAAQHELASVKKRSSYWVCGLCKASFLEENKLTAHMFSHTDQLRSEFQMDIENFAAAVGSQVESNYKLNNVLSSQSEKTEHSQHMLNQEKSTIQECSGKTVNTTSENRLTAQPALAESFIDSTKLLELQALTDFDFDILK